MAQVDSTATHNPPTRRWYSVLGTRYGVLVALVLLTGVALLLRRYRINQQSFWFDEADMVALAKAPFGTLLGDFTRASENGPLYTLLLNLWMRVLGDSEAAVRALSALIGAATMPLIYFFGRSLGGQRATARGWLAAGLLTVAPFHIWYSQEAKMYALSVLLTLASMYAFWRALQCGGRSDWAIYVLVTWLALYSHAMAVLVLAAQFVFYALDRLLTRQRPARGWTIATLILLLPIVPILLVRAEYLLRTPQVSQFYQPTSLLDIVQTAVVKFSLNRLPDGAANWEIVGGLLFATFVLIGLFSRGRRTTTSPSSFAGGGRPAPTTSPSPLAGEGRGGGVALLACYLLVPLVAFWLITLRSPLFEPRYLIVALPAWVLLTAEGILALGFGVADWVRGILGGAPSASTFNFAATSTPSRPSAAALVTSDPSVTAIRNRRPNPSGYVATALLTLPLLAFCAWALLGYNFSREATKEDWRGALLYVKTHMRAGDTIVVYPGYLKSAVDYYMVHGPGPADTSAVPVHGIEPKLVMSGKLRELDAAFADAIDGSRRAWLVQSPARVKLEDRREAIGRDWAGSVWWWLSGNQIQEDKRGEFTGIEVYGFNFNGIVGRGYPRPQTYSAIIYAAPNGDRLTLLGYNYEPRSGNWPQPAPDVSVTSGPAATTTRADFFPSILYWRVDNQQHGGGTLKGDYTMDVQLVDASGKPVTSQPASRPFNGYRNTAGWRVTESYTDFRDTWVGGDVPPGDYRLRVSVYPSDHPDQPLPASDSDGAPLGNAPTLSRTVRVTSDE